LHNCSFLVFLKLWVLQFDETELNFFDGTSVFDYAPFLVSPFLFLSRTLFSEPPLLWLQEILRVIIIVVMFLENRVSA